MITITFYNNSAEAERANKMAFLANETQIEGVFKDEISITNPTILIESNVLPNYNYCYINALKRFYFIDNINIIRESLFEIECHVDVLMTYYNILKEQVAFIDSQENNYNQNMIDSNRGFSQGNMVEEFTLENDLYDEELYINQADARYVLLGLGIDTGGAVEEPVNVEVQNE